MAIHDGYDKINTITGLDIPWEGKTGAEVEDFISRRFKNPLHSEIDYAGEVLSIKNPEGEVIAQGRVSVVPPNYTTDIVFNQLKVNGSFYTSDVTVNYTETSTFAAGINVKTYYEASGNTYNLSSKVDIIFSIEGTTDQLIVKNISPNNYTDDTLQFIDITPLFQKNLQGAKIKATVTANGKTGESIYAGSVTVHKIEISTSSTHVADQKVVFDIVGLSSPTGMSLYYYDVPLGTTDLSSIEPSSINLTSSTRVEVPLSVGGHQILARVSDSENRYYSNWTQANVVSWNKEDKTDMMAIIGGIPTSIKNCENSKLFQIISVPGLGGTVDIVSYLANDATEFENPQEQWPEFNRTSLSTDANDEPTVSDYYSYIELTNINNASKAVAFSLVVNDINYNLYSLEIVDGRLSGSNVFTIQIEENPYNINNAFNFVPGPIEDFSQITGQGTTLFKDVNENIEASDGWTIDSNLIAYKISGQGKDLFNTPKNFDSLLASGRGFTIEVMLKNYNINGEDPVMKIGNLLFGPGYARVASTNPEILVNSRADFEKDVITHLMFVFDPAYKPSTYNNIYNQLFDEGGTNYENFNRTYPILKIYVNGTINREIEVGASDLEDENGFKFQINPTSSDLNIYIFRTYNWAFSNAEIQKNRISSCATSQEKKEIYDRNDILGTDGRISFYKTMQRNNVMVVVIPETDKPLYFGNRSTNGDGKDPNDPENKKAQATLLVHYKDEKFAKYNGRFTGGKYKGQGSSAKKYMIHNVQYGSGKFISEEDIKAGKTETSSKYAMPTDDEQIKAKKFVGKVNYASSMQSHKQGSVKLFDKAYKQKVFKSSYKDKLYSGGKKACLEEAFVYFYYNLKPGQDINTITIDDLYSVDFVNGIAVPKDQDVKFFGFQTWGSAKADDPTYGYGDNTPEYLLVEGADNGAAGANFKQPWAAFQVWTPTKTYDEHKAEIDSKYNIQQVKSITDPESSTYDPTAGILLEGETIKFDSNGTDPWDIDYGLTELDEPNDLWQFTDEVKNTSLKYFVDFYNNCYTYDFTNLIANPNSDPQAFHVYNNYESTEFRIYMNRNNVKIYDLDKDGNPIEVDQASTFDVYRWDNRINKWVPGGLHYDGGKWEKFNLKSIYSNITSTNLFAKYSENSNVMNPTWVGKNIQTDQNIKDYVFPAFRDMFKANIEEYCDKDDVLYHQAFIRLVSGTDNRAKNTYFQIIGKLYTNEATIGEETVELVKIAEGDYKKKKGYIKEDVFYEVEIDGETVTTTGFTLPATDLELDDYFWKQTETGDYKIRLMQDDMDTIFATDNNGQQVKPYYLLEPPFNKETENKWGDHHSSFFYPLDICYYSDINNILGQIIDYLIGSATTVKDKNTLLYDYFFKTQLEFSEIMYNHHAEIYYEVPQNIFSKGGLNGFTSLLKGFANNNVNNPLSLSHGRCIESEYQFMKDRLLLLGTQSNSGHKLYGTEWALSSEGSGGNEGGTTFKATAQYTDYLYPTVMFKRSNGDEYNKLVNLTDKKDVKIPYDEVFTYVIATPGIPSVVSQLVTPEQDYTLSTAVDTTIPSYLSSAQKIKSLTVTQGLDVMHLLPNLPNVKYLDINGSTANYSVNTINIAVKDYIPIVETLAITNATFSNSILDFRNCNRLSTINLQGCIGIKNIIFPENNRLNTVYLPNDLKQLSLGVNPNLSVFEIPDGTKLTTLSLDCSAFNPNFDYINILTNYVDYSNLESFVFTNTPEEGLLITEDIANKLAEVQLDKNIQKSIKGKFIIKDRITNEADDGTITYTWGEKSIISYSTKKKLVNAFGKIDSETNIVYFDFQEWELGSHKISPEIAIDTPAGGITVYPFDGLFFQEGNDVKINDDGTLAIEYSIVNLPKDCTLDKNSGKLSIKENTNRSYTFNIKVTKVNGQLYDTISGSIYFGYKAPIVGDFAYSDGTFSSVLNTSKTLIGMVYQVEEVTAGAKWNLAILGTDSINGCFGADLYCYSASSERWSETHKQSKEQNSIYNFMTNSIGLKLPMTSPTNEGYLGISVNNYKYTEGGINYNYSIPETIVESGKTYTENFANVGLERLNTYIGNNSSFKSTLTGKKYYANNRLQNINTIADFEEVCDLFNESVVNQFPSGVDYSKTLNPIYIKASLYEPQDLTGTFATTNYSKGNWYIPSIAELELLIYYRIRSTAKETDTNIESYWNSTEYNNGNSIFSSTSSEFKAFLNSDMIASQASINNKSYAYGRTTEWGTSVANYGWNYSYPYVDYEYQPAYLDQCKRDIAHTVALCCQVTVTKNS